MPATRGSAPIPQNRTKDYLGQALPPPSDLLKHIPVYGVLICTGCRYAIKPGGLARHLKDIHRLHNDKRRPYTLYASNLHLKNPEDVIDPPDDDFPMQYLPLEQGWKCCAPGCHYLCASTKRMETHWPSKHGCKGNPTHDWIPVPIQTFFRGNMLRYFTTENRDRPSLAPRNLPAASNWVEKTRSKYRLDAIDSLTIEHYFYSSYRSFTKPDQTEGLWLNLVAELAYHHKFLLHGILACTALHMAHLYPAKREMYIVRAHTHQDSALPLFRNEIEHPTDKNCDAIMAFAYLLIVFSFATELDNGQNSFLLINDTPDSSGGEQLILPQWLHLIRCGCEMLNEVWENIEMGPARELAYAWEVELDVGDSKLPYLQYFMSIVPRDGSWSEQIIAVYQEGACALAEAFAYMERGTEVDMSTWNILGLWCVRLENEFYDLILEKHPGALILLAYYCVIMKRMESCWYFGGRPARLFTAVKNVLDERWHPYLQDAEDRILESSTVTKPLLNEQ